MPRFLPLALAFGLAFGFTRVVGAIDTPYAGSSAGSPPFAGNCASPASAFRTLSAGPTPRAFVPGTVIVRLRTPSPDFPRQLFASPHIDVRCSLGTAGTHLLAVPVGSEEAVAASLRASPLVASAEPDYVRRLAVMPSDPMIGAQWALSKINAPAAWDITTGSADVIVAVLDSGIDQGHPDLKDKLVDGYNFFAPGTAPSDDVGHGTHVAGIIAAAANNGQGVAGVSWNVRIMPLKVTDRFGSTSDSILAGAIRHAADQGVRVINMSLGGPENSVTLRDAVEYAAGRGSLIVASAGNCYSGGAACGGQTNPTIYPAAFSQVMAVGATSSADVHASYSETGNYLSVVAPGGDQKNGGDTDSTSSILSTYSRMMIPSGYTSLAGTSQAAPHVSGLAALVWSVNPRLTAPQVREIIETTAIDLGDPGKDTVYGAGRIDALAAVRRAQSNGGVTPTPAPTGTPTPSPSPTPTPVSAAVPVASGGDVRLGGVTVTVPPDVVTGESQVTLRVALFTASRPPDGMLVGSSSFDVTMQGASGQPITQLARPLTISVLYTDTDLANAGGNPANIVMGVLDPVSDQWQSIPTTTDNAAKTVSSSPNHLTKFSVLTVLPAPKLTAPDSGAVAANFAPQLTWTNAAGTTQYQIQVLPFNQDGPAINLIRNAEASFAVPAPVFGSGNYILLPGMTYTWRVRTTTLPVRLQETDPGWSLWDSRSFVTPAPTSAGLRPLQPAEGAPVSSLTPTLTWTNNAPSIFYYEVQVSKDPSFTVDPATAIAPVYWNLIHGGQTAPLNSYAVPPSAPLEADARYFWRVRPRVQGDGAPVAWSPTWSFQTP